MFGLALLMFTPPNELSHQPTPTQHKGVFFSALFHWTGNLWSHQLIDQLVGSCCMNNSSAIHQLTIEQQSTFSKSTLWKWIHRPDNDLIICWGYCSLQSTYSNGMLWTCESESNNNTYSKNYACIWSGIWLCIWQINCLQVAFKCKCLRYVFKCKRIYKFTETFECPFKCSTFKCAFKGICIW